MSDGSNLPNFRKQQLDFTAHVRNPQLNDIPEGVEPRRMKVYLELVFNNLESFLANSFPVTRSCFSDEVWFALVRDYLHRHKASSPYFQEIPQEFMEYLSITRSNSSSKPSPNSSPNSDDPPWLLELCHYEWVELALDVAELELPWESVDQNADLMSSRCIVSPLIWSLGYHWPVHTIGPDTWGSVVERPTYLIVFRDRLDKVRCIESDPATSRFLELLEGEGSLRECIDQMNDEIPNLTSAEVEEKMLATLKSLRGADIVLGPASAAGKAPQ